MEKSSTSSTKMPLAGADATATATALPKTVVAADGRRMRLVDEETLRYFRSRPLIRPATTRTTYSAELMRKLGFSEQEVETLLRAYGNERNERRIQEDVLEQYGARGYAYLEIPELYPGDSVDEHAYA